jgi:hypothetical protein
LENRHLDPAKAGISAALVPPRLPEMIGGAMLNRCPLNLGNRACDVGNWRFIDWLRCLDINTVHLVACVRFPLAAQNKPLAANSAASAEWALIFHLKCTK